MFAVSFYVFLTHHWTFELVAALLDSIGSKILRQDACWASATPTCPRKTWEFICLTFHWSESWFLLFYHQPTKHIQVVQIARYYIDNIFGCSIFLDLQVYICKILGQDRSHLRCSEGGGWAVKAIRGAQYPVGQCGISTTSRSKTLRNPIVLRVYQLFPVVDIGCWRLGTLWAMNMR